MAKSLDENNEDWWMFSVLWYLFIKSIRISIEPNISERCSISSSHAPDKIKLSKTFLLIDGFIFATSKIDLKKGLKDTFENFKQELSSGRLRV